MGVNVGSDVGVDASEGVGVDVGAKVGVEVAAGVGVSVGGGVGLHARTPGIAFAVHTPITIEQSAFRHRTNQPFLVHQCTLVSRPASQDAA